MPPISPSAGAVQRAIASAFRVASNTPGSRPSVPVKLARMFQTNKTMRNIRSAGVSAQDAVKFAKALNQLGSISRNAPSAAHREFAADTASHALAAIKAGGIVAAAATIASGLSTIFPVRVQAADRPGDQGSPSGHPPLASALPAATTTVPVIEPGDHNAAQAAQAKAMISRADENLHAIQLDANTDAVKNDVVSDRLLQMIRDNPKITIGYRNAITEAARLANEGKPSQAISHLRGAAAHAPIERYFGAPVSAANE